MGQTPPELIPKIFASGFISTRYHEHSSPNFNSEMNEIIYTLSCEYGHVMMITKLEDGEWSIPKAMEFSGKYSDDGHVRSSDGTKLYFRSKRPANFDTLNKAYTNWVVSKNDTGWSKPIPNNFEAYSFSCKGVNYFQANEDTTGWDIFFSRPESDYKKPKKLGSAINTVSTDATPFIASDESFLLFASMGREDGIGIMDLYISFRNENRTWSKAINMGEPINKEGHISRFPRVSPDGKYLFYWSNINNDETLGDSLTMAEKSMEKYDPWRPENGMDGDIYWVSSEIIDKLKENR